MNLDIDAKYSTFSTSIIFHLLHNSEEYKELWKEKYPHLNSQLDNFFKNENCGCRPVLLQQYKKTRFDIDVMTVDFINNNPDVINIDEFCETTGSQDLRGTVFHIPNNVSSYKDFLASLQQKRASFNTFNAILIEDNIVVTFF